MKQNFISCTGCYYIVKDENGKVKLNITNHNCFRMIPDNLEEGKDVITITEFRCEKSDQYTQFYLQYIVDMLKLENTVITEDSFSFPAFKHRLKNIFVLSFVRILFEMIGGSTLSHKGKLNLELLENLLNGECDLEDKISRFCFFYRKLSYPEKEGYWAAGHYPIPQSVKIQTYKSYKNHEFNKNTINGFFAK